MMTNLLHDIDHSICPQIKLVGILALICLLATFLRYQIIDIPLERDEGEYAYIAQRWLTGAVPYLTVFDQKPPAIFAVYAVIFKTLGTSPAAIHWGAHFFVLISLLLIFLLGKLLFSPKIGLIAAFFAGILFNDPSLLGNAANTEIFMTMPLVASLLAAVMAVKKDQLRWSLAAGVFCALALLFKQVALPNVIFTLIFLFLGSKHRWAHLIICMVGILSPLILVAYYFFSHGALGALYDCLIAYNQGYASQIPPYYYPSLIWVPALYIFASTYPICFMSIIGLFTRNELVGVQSANKSILILSLWFLASLIGVSVGGQFRLHYFIQLVPALSLLASLGFVSVLTWMRRSSVVLRFAFPLLVIIYPLLLNNWYYSAGDPLGKAKHLYDVNPFAESPEVGRYLENNSSPRDRIFILGSEPQILFYANRISVSRYIFCHPLVMPFPGRLKRQQEVLEELKKQPPRFIITVFLTDSLPVSSETPQAIFSALAKKLTTEYQLVALLPSTAKNTAALITNKSTLKVWRYHPWWYHYGDSPFTLAIWKKL